MPSVEQSIAANGKARPTTWNAWANQTYCAVSNEVTQVITEVERAC